MARYELQQCWQNPDESADLFLKRLCQIAKQCEYKQVMEDMLVVDLFIFSIYFKSAQKSLIKEGSDLTIAKALRIAEMEEATCKQVEAIHISLEESSMHMAQSKSKRKLTQCGYCGRDHPRGECPARGKTCSICNEKRPFTNVCRSKMKDKKKNNKGATKPQGHKNRRIHTAIQNESNSDLSEEVYFHSVQNLLSHATEAYAKLKIGNKQGQILINAKIDTGTMSNLLPKKVLENLTGVQLKKTLIWLITFSGTMIDQEGTCWLGIRFPWQIY